MESKIILGRILQRLIDQTWAQVDGYNQFGFLSLQERSVKISREKGLDTIIPFKKIIAGIEAYKLNPEEYNSGPVTLRKYDISRVESPVFALLHLLPQEAYSIN